MINLLRFNTDKGKLPSVINDPFKKKNVTRIHIVYFGDCYNPYWYARITFTNGNTSGEQKTPDCATFDEVMQHIKAIEESLNIT